MKRREALKNIGLTSALFVATPAFISFLQSCKNETTPWIPQFLTNEEGTVLKNLVDVILPSTDDLPSALDLNIPQLIDKYMNEVFDDELQLYYKNAFNGIIKILNPNTEASIETVLQEDYKALLDKHMLLEDEIDEEREFNPESLELTKSEFLNSIKWMTINTYKSTKEIGKEVLVYDPIPGAYYCDDLNKLTGGKSWSF